MFDRDVSQSSIVALAISATLGIALLLLASVARSGPADVHVVEDWSAYSRVDRAQASFSIDLVNSGERDAIITALDPISGLELQDAWLGPGASLAYAGDRPFDQVQRLPAVIGAGEQLDLVVFWTVSDCEQLPMTFDLSSNGGSYGVDERVAARIRNGSEIQTLDLTAQGPIEQLAKHLLDEGGCG